MIYFRIQISGQSAASKDSILRSDLTFRRAADITDVQFFSHRFGTSSGLMPETTGYMSRSVCKTGISEKGQCAAVCVYRLTGSTALHYPVAFARQEDLCSILNCLNPVIYWRIFLLVCLCFCPGNIPCRMSDLPY